MLGYNHFTYRDGVLHCDDISIETIAENIGTPAYIYSARHFTERFTEFKNAFAGRVGDDRFLVAFAVKACPNISVLRLLGGLGAGADIVSEGEMRRALLAGINPQKIMFSGVGKTATEISFALDNHIGMINVESEAELYVISHIATQKGLKAPISLRINPDVTTNTLPGISTGKKGDKFGIGIDHARDVYRLAHTLSGLDVKGLDFHIGSQVFDIEEFRYAFVKVRDLVGILRSEDKLHVGHIDCGGGLGVPYHPEETPPNMSDYANLVLEYFGDMDVSLAFEPGRFIVGNAGILITEVIYEKQDNDWNCLIVDSGMNDLARPAMYGAYHHIVPVKEPQDNALKNYDVVGPVCESTDTFAKGRSLPIIQTGDRLAFLTAGAYGASMSSRYNSRLDIPEILVENGGYKIIRKRPDYAEIFAPEL